MIGTTLVGLPEGWRGTKLFRSRPRKPAVRTVRRFFASDAHWRVIVDWDPEKQVYSCELWLVAWNSAPTLQELYTDVYDAVDFVDWYFKVLPRQPEELVVLEPALEPNEKLLDEPFCELTDEPANT
jgi:hypothetical protein